MLFQRIVGTGTLDEPEGVPKPQFALPSTINWMTSLRLMVQNEELSFSSALEFYQSVSRRTFQKQQEENTVLEQLYFALHQLSTLSAFRSCPCKSDISRMGIVTWYYGVYYAASAMIAAQDGTTQGDHAGTATSWGRQIVENHLSMSAFRYRVSSLVGTSIEDEIKSLRNGNSFDLLHKPENKIDAHGACCAYLSGTARWYAERVENDVKRSKEFKALNVGNFRTNPARMLRDQRLVTRGCCFLHQAFRYRGKANYREALFLGYGENTETQLTGYVDDLYTVLAAFLSMAGAFCSKRLSQNVWQEFLEDIEKNRSFSISANVVWK